MVKKNGGVIKAIATTKASGLGTCRSIAILYAEMDSMARNGRFTQGKRKSQPKGSITHTEKRSPLAGKYE